MAVNIKSTAEWDKMLGGHAVVIADFFADWCGPCKMIAPTFESLATKFSKPGRIAFAKVNTDTQGDIAARYSVRSMPTFKIFHRGSVTDTVQGANPPGLTAAVDKAVKLAGVGPAGSGGGSLFSGSGHTLGGTPISTSSNNSRRAGGAAAGRTVGPRSGGAGLAWLRPGVIFSFIRTVLGLYFVTLFSLDPYKAAEASAFNVNRVEDPRARTVGGAPAPRGKPGAATEKPRIQTLADL